MTNLGYYSQPAIHNDFIVFVSDDDLWRVTLEGGRASRLTANLGVASAPKISPDGESISYLGEDSGSTHLSIIPVSGGAPKRLLHLPVTRNLGWKDSSTLLVVLAYESFHRGENYVYELNIETNKLKKINVGPATNLHYGKKGAILLGRNCGDPSRWKRYKGGTAGVLWVKKDAKNKFQRILKQIKTNISTPLLIDETIYFISDHEGIANVYSCNMDGKQLKRLTKHSEFYVRHLSTDGQSLVYQCGSEIHYYKIQEKSETKVKIDCPTPGVQAQPRYIGPTDFLESFSVSDNLEKLGLISRGHPILMSPWKGAPQELSASKDIRFALPVFSKDSKKMYAIGHDSQEEEHLFEVDLGTKLPKKILTKEKWGKVWELSLSPKGHFLGLVNNRNELWLIDVKKHTKRLIEKNTSERPQSLTWSPDGKYLVYSATLVDLTRKAIKTYNVKTKEHRNLLNPIISDHCPSFDPQGKYLYFIGARELKPTFSEVHFDAGFPFATRPYVVMLEKETPSPFDNLLQTPKLQVKKKETETRKTKEVLIDFDGIDHRILPFPLDQGGYQRVSAVAQGILYIKDTVGPTHDSWMGDPVYPDLHSFSFETQKSELFYPKVAAYKVVADGEYILLKSEEKLRLIPTKTKPNTDQGFNNKDGWIDLNRIKLKIDPKAEWKQMYREAWVLQREHFWRSDMSKVDWLNIYQRYLPLLDRVKTRREFSDLIWEMQGELGTSHCYEFGGDYHRTPPRQTIGYLGAQFEFVPTKKTFKVVSFFESDSWVSASDSPLLTPAVGLKIGDQILEIDGFGFQTELSLFEALENKGKIRIELKVRRKGAKKTETVTVIPLPSQMSGTYRTWVEKNREKVYQLSKGRLGYIHIPDMGFHGFSEFYRNFLREYRKEGLVIDVRYNGGGFVSQLLLRMLAQKPIGLDLTRHQGFNHYPLYAVAGSMVAITNELAGSDGDIFSHAFKLMKLGKLVGKRTWGGVIGINGQYQLRDKTMTTQPEYSFWFTDVGWDVENYGTDPDVEVEITPEEWSKQQDPQLEKAVEIALNDLKKNPAFKPEIKEFPNLSFPQLPK